MKYMSIGEAAKLWGITERRVQQMCKSGAIDGATKNGIKWSIPEDTKNPVKNVQKPIASGNLPLPVGVSSYIEAVSKYYYVDKTLLIKDFIDSLPKVSLFTRPRRFGKTLNMDMLRVFFERNDMDTSIYFRDKKIWECGERYQEYQGRFPVIFLTFKDVKYNSWEKTLKDIKDNIRAEFARHEEIALSPECNSYEKAYFKKVIDGATDDVEAARSLSVLSSMLSHHYKEKTVIIIDEYDTPIQQGYICNYYDDAIDFIRNLFSGAFKDNPNLAYGFMTGILRVAKESIFSGMNNLKVNTIMDDRYSEYFGFTEREVREILQHYRQENKLGEVREWYDGYRFGQKEIFNPWSVINYVDEKCIPNTFWQSTGSNDIIGEIISNATPEIMEKLRRLMQGESISAYIDTSVIYPDIRRKPTSIYSFLLVAGYLRNTAITPQNDGYYMCKVAIPNKEISFVYEKEIIAKLHPELSEPTALAIQQAVYDQNTDVMIEEIRKYLLQTISAFDIGNEAFYQGLMIGLCAILNNRYYVTSNRESGLGRFDIQLKPQSSNLPGIIFELKATKDEKANLDKLARTAYDQIIEKKYDVSMQTEGIDTIIKIGIAFCGKNAAQYTE